MVVGDGNDGAMVVRQVMERNLVVRTQNAAQKLRQPYILGKQCAAHTITSILFWGGAAMVRAAGSLIVIYSIPYF